MIKILDSTSLIAFYYDIKAPDVLHKICNTGYKIKIPTSVYGELIGESFLKLKRDVDQRKIELFDNSNQDGFMKIKNRYPNLRNGEIEVIVWGLECKYKRIKYYCVLDDKLARKVAQKIGINFTGTLGLIDFLVRRNEINQEDKSNLITKLKKSKFRI